MRHHYGIMWGHFMWCNKQKKCFYTLSEVSIKAMLRTTVKEVFVMSKM